MDAKAFKEEVLKHYIDEEYLITITRDPGKWTSGNGLLFTSIFYSVLAINDQVTREDKERLSTAIDLCWVGPLGQPIKGLLERNDGREDAEAHDDYHIATASFLLGTHHATNIADYGSSHYWSFNNTNPNQRPFISRDFWKFWHGRFPGHVAYLELAGRRNPSCLQRQLLNQKIKSGPSDKTDTNIMSWLKCQVMLKSHSMYRAVAVDWLHRAENKYGSLGSLCEGYFGKDHPFAKIPTIYGVFNTKGY